MGGGLILTTKLDELLLMTEVDSLQSQLKRCGESFDKKIATFFMKSIETAAGPNPEMDN